jgi:hypothetical protein
MDLPSADSNAKDELFLRPTAAATATPTATPANKGKSNGKTILAAASAPRVAKKQLTEPSWL